MINGKRVLAIIPARGGSKGVPRKNIYPILGRPLIAWTIDAANDSTTIDRVVLSSDDDDIIRVAKSLGCDVPFVRPAEFATDEASPVDAVVHAINSIDEKYDYIVLLQVTSPLRAATDIDSCVELCVSKGASSAVSVTEIDKSPYWMYRLSDEYKMTPVLNSEDWPSRRQDAPEVYELNGAVYVVESESFLKNRTFLTDETLAYVMPKERSLDIDTEMDIKYLKHLLEKNSELPS